MLMCLHCNGRVGLQGRLDDDDDDDNIRSNIPGKHEVKELQKTAILGTTSESTNVKIQ